MASLDFTIAVAQMDCVVGETAPNLNKIGHFAALAKPSVIDFVAD